MALGDEVALENGSVALVISADTPAAGFQIAKDVTSEGTTQEMSDAAVTAQKMTFIATPVGAPPVGSAVRFDLVAGPEGPSSLWLVAAYFTAPAYGGAANPLGVLVKGDDATHYTYGSFNLPGNAINFHRV